MPEKRTKREHTPINLPVSRERYGIKNTVSVRLHILPLLVSMIFFTGCGYSVRGNADLPLKEITITSILNKTYEPDIEDTLHQNMAVEFMRQGISVRNASAYQINGEIQEFTLIVVSEKNDFSSEYEVVIKANFTLTGPDGLRKELMSIRSPFHESFIAEREINSIVALQEIATDKALKELSRRLVAEVIYR